MENDPGSGSAIAGCADRTTSNRAGSVANFGTAGSRETTGRVAAEPSSGTHARRLEVAAGCTHEIRQP